MACLPAVYHALACCAGAARTAWLAARRDPAHVPAHGRERHGRVVYLALRIGEGRNLPEGPHYRTNFRPEGVSS